MASTYVVDERFDRSAFDGASCAFGVFDGVHRGHRFLLGQAMATAAETGGRSVALTFDIDPDELFHADRLKKLQSNGARLAELAESGVDAVFVLPFTREFAARSPQEFLAETFADHAPACLHVGSDFEFGSRASGRVGDLRTWAETRGTRICAHRLLAADGSAITATRIRLLLAAGDVEEAAALLGRPYRLCGEVRPGRGEGRDLGFRTANLHVPDMMRPIGDGVYACHAHVGGRTVKAAVSVGVSPVFAEEARATCEVHLLDFDGDLYGQRIAVDFERWLRPMIAFDSVDELVATVEANIVWVREHLD